MFRVGGGGVLPVTDSPWYGVGSRENWWFTEQKVDGFLNCWGLGQENPWIPKLYLTQKCRPFDCQLDRGSSGLGVFLLGNGTMEDDYCGECF